MSDKGVKVGFVGALIFLAVGGVAIHLGQSGIGGVLVTLGAYIYGHAEARAHYLKSPPSPSA